MKFGLIGVPWDFTSSLGWPGSRYAPDAVRAAFRWINMRLETGEVYWLDREQLVKVPEEGLVEDLGDVQVLADDREASFRRIEEKVAGCISGGRIPLVVGGDDAVTYPAVKALHDATDGSWGLIHLDAHLDLMDRSDYQGAHSHSSGIRRVTELSRFATRSMIQVGVRNFNFAASHEYVTRTGITHLSAAEYWRIGTDEAVQRSLACAASADHIHLAVDIDVLDPAFAPGAGAFEPGGLMPRQLFDFVAAVAPRVDSLSLVEVNPLTDFRTQTAAVAANVLAHFVVGRLTGGR